MEKVLGEKRYNNYIFYVESYIYNHILKVEDFLINSFTNHFLYVIIPLQDFYIHIAENFGDVNVKNS